MYERLFLMTGLLALGGNVAEKPQHPTLFAPYKGVRPPWKVAGVDYRVGVPTGIVLADPDTLRNRNGISVLDGDPAKGINNVVRINDPNTTISGIDFSVRGGYYVIVAPGATNSTIARSNFVMGANNTYYLIQAYADNFTLLESTLDGDTGLKFASPNEPNESALIAVYGRNPVIKYDWMKNTVQHFLEMNQTSGTSTLHYQFNLLENGGAAAATWCRYRIACSPHVNYLQLGNAAYYNMLVEYNTTVQPLEPAGGEQFQFYGFSKATIRNALFEYNTTLAPAPLTNPPATSYIVHLDGLPKQSQGFAENNYFDKSNAYGNFYPVNKPTLWVCAANTNLTTGRAVNGCVP